MLDESLQDRASIILRPSATLFHLLFVAFWLELEDISGGSVHVSESSNLSLIYSNATSLLMISESSIYFSIH